MPQASITGIAGMPASTARSALDGVPSNRPMAPSTRIRSACVAASASRQRHSASPVIQGCNWYTGAPLARSRAMGSR